MSDQKERSADWSDKIKIRYPIKIENCSYRIVATCGVMGFASVVKATPSFQTLIDVIPDVKLPPLLSLFFMTNGAILLFRQ